MWDRTVDEGPNDWRVPRMAGLARFPSDFRANSERTADKFRANSGQISSEFRASSEQASQTLYFLVTLCNEAPWLADNEEHISPLWERKRRRP